MKFDPTNWQTWSRYEDHPVFGPEKFQITDWSQDPSQYSDLSTYSRFLPEHYVHLDPPPALESQQKIAIRDIKNLSMSCEQLIGRYGSTTHEMVILDDFTVFVWMKNEHFSLSIYPLQLENEYQLMLFAESPLDMDEIRCRNVNELVQFLFNKVGH